MSSSASEVSATLSLASSQWLQGPPPVQETNSQPFETLLDAAAATRNAAATAPNPPPATVQPATSASGTASQAGPSASVSADDANSTSPLGVISNPVSAAIGRDKGSASSAGSKSTDTAAVGGKNAISSTPHAADANANPTNGNAALAPWRGGRGASQAKTSGPATAAAAGNGATANTSASAPAVRQTTANAATAVDSKAATNSDTTNSAIAPTSGPATANNMGTATAANSEISQQVPQVSTSASSWRGRKDAPEKDAAETDNSSGYGDTVAGIGGQAQAPANQAQPVASAFSVNEQASTAPAPAAATVTSVVVGDEGKGRAKLIPTATGQNAVSTDTDNGTEVAATPRGSSAGGNEAGTSGLEDIAKTPARANTPQTSTQTVDRSTPTAQTADNSATTAQTNESVPTDVDRPAAPAADLSAASSSTATGTSNAPGGTGTTKADANGLPNFGLSPSVATTSLNASAPTAASSASDAAVSISGLAVAISARAQSGSNQFDIRLDPPELGRIDVRLDVDSNGQVTTHMTADRPDTLQLLQNQQPQLERALEQAGLKTADNGLQFTLRDQSFTGQNNGSAPQQNSGTAQLIIPDPDLSPVAATQIYSRVGLGNGVDIRV